MNPNRFPSLSRRLRAALFIPLFGTVSLFATDTLNDNFQMNAHPSYTTSFTVDRTPNEVFAAINNVRDWWSAEIDGATDQLGEFKYHYKDIHRCTIRITTLSPGRKVAWHVVDNSFNFVKDPREWVGTDIIFEITRVGGKTELRFTHEGLSATQECYGVCSDAWTAYINGSLRDLIVRGTGRPNQNEQLARKHGQE